MIVLKSRVHVGAARARSPSAVFAAVCTHGTTDRIPQLEKLARCIETQVRRLDSDIAACGELLRSPSCLPQGARQSGEAVAHVHAAVCLRQASASLRD